MTDTELTEFTADQASRRRTRWLQRAKFEARFLRPGYFDKHTWAPQVADKVDAYMQAFLAGRVAGKLSTTSDLQGKGLLLYGPSGTGKTSLATKFGIDLIQGCDIPRGFDPSPAFHQSLTGSRETVRSVFYSRWDGYLDILKAMFNMDDALAGDDGPVNDYQQIAIGITAKVPKYTISLLIADDAGKEYRTDWANAIFENIIRARFGAGLPTIVTTNLDPKDWAKVYGDSVASFAREAFIPIAMLGDDRRRKKGSL